MDSEFDPAEAKTLDMNDVCEEVILAASVSNGDDYADADRIIGECDIDYIEEKDPMSGLGDSDLIEQVEYLEGEVVDEDIEEVQDYEIVKSVDNVDDDGVDDVIIENIEHDDMNIIEEDIEKSDINNDSQQNNNTEDGVLEETPTEVPKKSTTPESTLENDADVNTIEQDTTKSPKSDIQRLEKGKVLKENLEEQPTSSTRSGANKDEIVDEEQCRVCTGKEDLVSIFKSIGRITIADQLMTVCPSISIAPKDFMPQYICNTCLDNVTIAIQLKNQAETTERELRKKLSRSKNKVRRPRGFVVIDAPVDSDPPSEEPNDDVEFKVSDEAVSSADDDSEDSDFSGKKKRSTRTNVSSRGRQRKSTINAPTTTAKKTIKKRMGKSLTNSTANDEDQQQNAPNKKKRFSQFAEEASFFKCDECDQIFVRKVSLIKHKRVHKSETMKCKICGKEFKMKGAYIKHLTTSHKMYYCPQCSRELETHAEFVRHMAEIHDKVDLLHECRNCHRTFVTIDSLYRHRRSNCFAYIEAKPKRNEFENLAIGKDLFKSVAPPTTTYWSDSFSD